MDTLVQCRECGYEREVSYATCTFKTGWPRHCGSTMRMVKSPSNEDMSKIYDSAFSGLAATVGAAIKKAQEQP